MIWAAAAFVAGAGVTVAAATPGLFDSVGCYVAGDIKGNISEDGERIYHEPGQRYYDATMINWLAGERNFCTTADARAAGWQRSRV